MKFTIAESYADHLCLTCNHGRVTHTRDGDTFTICHIGMTDQRITSPVVQCTDYNFRWGQSPHEMDKVAWILEIKPESREFIGFRKPKKDKDD